MDVSGHILRAWMPAIHAGMTEATDAWRKISPFSCPVGERKIMDQFVSKHLMFVIGLAWGATTVCFGGQKEAAKSEDWKRGRAVYISSCSACHNRDPAKDGPLGPAVLGASKELLEALILRGEYPPNYKPKRPTKTMPKMPFLEPEIPYLATYLGS